MDLVKQAKYEVDVDLVVIEAVLVPDQKFFVLGRHCRRLLQQKCFVEYLELRRSSAPNSRHQSSNFHDDLKAGIHFYTRSFWELKCCWMALVKLLWAKWPPRNR